LTTESIDVDLTDSAVERGRVSIVATQPGNLANRQTDLLVDPHRNVGLSPLLAARPGREHALPGVRLPATSTTREMQW
jgi:tyrosine ammonia-lyase